jgi:hypothetical protein
MQTPQKILLDAREMEHPTPLEQAMKILQRLEVDNYFYMIHRKNPLPLIDLAQEHQLQTLSHEDKEGVWHILISKNPNHPLEELLHV